MASAEKQDHQKFVQALRDTVLDRPGETTVTLRRSAADRAAGGSATEAIYDDLLLQIGVDATRVTDAQVADALRVLGSQKATFEVIAAAAVGAGLLRWRRGVEALKEAGDAAE
jgi:hypothetical protein